MNQENNGYSSEKHRKQSVNTDMSFVEKSIRAPSKRRYYCCIVPMCTNTSVTTPEKIFVSVPKDPVKRRRWLEACRRNPDDISLKSSANCCEDHFNLEVDMENWMQYRLMGGRMFMKPDVLPSLFDCQKQNLKGIYSEALTLPTDSTVS